MEIKNYLMIQNNIVTNVIVWDGDVNSWQPPIDALMLPQETTPSKLWWLDESATPPTYILKECIGEGEIGDTWDGKILTTSDPKPTDPTLPTSPAI